MKQVTKLGKACIFIILVCLPCFLHAKETFRILSWNIEGSDSNPFFIAYQLSNMEGYDLIGLCEVNPKDSWWIGESASYGEGQNNRTPQFQHFTGTTGGSIRLMLIWDEQRLRLGEEGIIELHHLSQGNHRAPLTAHFVMIDSGNDFFVVLNHLARGDEALRQRQTEGIKEWSMDKNAPVLLMGDFNYDYNLDTGNGNTSFDLMIGDGDFRWAEPEDRDLAPTYLSKKYYSVLDFFFTYNFPDSWEFTSQVLHQQQTEDSSATSDHRPIKGILTLP